MRVGSGPACPGFTIVELLVVIAIIGVLAGLLLPALIQSKAAAQRVQCASGLRQFGLAAQMYWDDNQGNAFAYRGATTNNGNTYWFGWLANGAEEQRAFDPTAGALYPYIQNVAVGVCPSLNYHSPQFKLKATNAICGYGYNLLLSPASGPPVRVRNLAHSAGVVLLADAAQVNTFEAPASPSNPMIEEFYYVNTNEATVHFRHQANANAVFCDGHVELQPPVTGSIDQRLPAANIGYLPSTMLLTQ